MKMEVLPSTVAYSDDDTQNLERLLDTFGSVVSLQDIASAYCQAGRDLQTASDILCNLQGSSSETSDLLSVDGLENNPSASLICSSEIVPEKAQFKLKPKKCSASVGTVSGVIGREYVRSRPSTNEFSTGTKPLILNANDFPTSEILDEKDTLDTTTRRETMHQDVAEFLFEMLGDGFSLNMEIIQNVVGQCGYDVKKSMEKLLDLSASAFRESQDIPIVTSEKPMEENLDLRPTECQEISRSRPSSVTGNRVQSTTNKDRSELQKEVLEALFNVPERIAKEPERIHEVKAVRRSRPFGQVVAGPPKEPIVETRTIVTRLQVNQKLDEETEDDFEVQERASKEYWNTMTEYYRAGVEAYIAGDLERAHKLQEEGQFFMKKAREANEKAAQMLIQTRDFKEHVSIDLQDFEPKDAMRLLKVQLTSLSGIPSIQYLKLIVGDEDAKAGRRKRLIIKLLEMESITWSEEENGRVMVIPVGDINPKKLSFAKK